MGLGATLLFYLLFGTGVAVAVLLVDDRLGPAERGFRLATALLFWPIYVPILLAGPKPSGAPCAESVPPADDDMATLILQVQQELDAALDSLDGWAEGVLGREEDRIEELKSAWFAQAARVREMDALLARADSASFDAIGPNATDPVTDHAETPNADTVDDSTPPPCPAPETRPQAAVNERVLQSERSRRENLDRLKRIRKQSYDDLIGMLAWVRELATMIHLAKFTGAPVSRAEELVAQIATAVEGLSQASTWRDSPSPETNAVVSGQR